MALIKHNDRSRRQACERCGKTGQYWAHDTDVHYIKDCDKCGVNGKFTLCDKDYKGDMVPHSLTCSASAGAQPSTAEIADTAPVATPVPDMDALTSGPPADKLAALQGLLAMLAPSVSPEQVKAEVATAFGDYGVKIIDTVDQRIASISKPLQIEIKTDAGIKPVTGSSHKAMPDILTCVSLRLHCLMVGPAGTGKSTIADQAAEALGLEYYSISLSPQTPASSILGYMQAAGEYVRSLYREAYEHGGVFHFDEFDNAHPSVLAVINASLANGQMAFPDQMVKRHPDFVCLASANTYGRGADRAYVGRQAIDAATLDRFIVVTVDVDEALEKEICESTGATPDTVRMVLAYVRALRANAVNHKMPLVFSPRASHGMCKLIKAGMPVDKVIEMRARRGISDTDWSKISAGATRPSI